MSTRKLGIFSKKDTSHLQLAALAISRSALLFSSLYAQDRIDQPLTATARSK